jgi:hypothetical protein
VQDRRREAHDLTNNPVAAQHAALADPRQETSDTKISAPSASSAVYIGPETQASDNLQSAICNLQSEAALTFAIDAQRVIGTLPRIGLGLAHAEAPLAEAELALLPQLRPAHLRVDLDLADAQYTAVLARAVAESDALHTALEIALFLSQQSAPAEIAALRTQLHALQPRVMRWLIFSRERPITPPALAALARAQLADYAPDAVFAGGSNSDYIFVDRGIPLPPTLDALTVAINPQVHAFDNRSLVETLAAQQTLVADARHYADERAVIVSPVTLRPRFNPYATVEVRIQDSGFSSAGTKLELPPNVDRRQASLFGAAWTLGSLRYLALGGAHSVTYYETHGGRGVLLPEVRSQKSEVRSIVEPLSRLLPMSERVVFPLFHVLADVAEMPGASFAVSESSEPLLVDGLALVAKGQLLVLLANMSAQPQRVQLRGLGERASLRMLDRDTLAEALAAPLAWRARSEEIATPGGEISVDLAPYALVRLAIASIAS